MTRTRRFDLVAAAALAAVLALVALVAVATQHHRSGAAAAWPAARAEPAALTVLHDWDAARAAAYATGSPRRLAQLYVPGSAAGSADLRVLRSYRARGLRVVGMRTQVLAVRAAVRTATGWRVRVTERLVGAAAERSGLSRALPLGRPGTRDLRLVPDGAGRWRVAEATTVR